VCVGLGLELGLGLGFGLFYAIYAFYTLLGKSSESVQWAMLKACDACAEMGSYSALY